MNNIKKIIHDILSVPERFKNSDNQKSFYNLLKDTGYFQVADQISEDMILTSLHEHPEFIKSWINWSEEKRTDSGWCIKKNKNGDYSVFFFSKKGESEHIESNDAEIACASFIKKEIESIKNLH